MRTNRTIGIEMEGYVLEYPEQITMPYSCEIGNDESLSNCYWEDDSRPYGVEIRTRPFVDLKEIYPIVSEMMEAGWNAGEDDEAGTHIHVDISDFSALDKAKLLRFGKGIERIIFSFVEGYRYKNSYCGKIEKDWRRVFWKKSSFRKINWSKIGNSNEEIDDHLNENGYELYNGKYAWMNVMESDYSTVEFRLFHVVKSAKQLEQQAKLAYAIVQLVKNSTVEQLEFIIKSLYKSDTTDEVFNKFFEVMNIEPMDVIENKAYRILKKKIEGAEEVQEQEMVTA